MSPAPLAVAVLISGTGSNLKTLIDANDNDRLELDFRLVISNREMARGLEHARKAGIPSHILSPGTRQQQDLEIKQCLLDCGAELVILAGYMRIIGESLVNAFSGRMINLHPSLLPLYPGLDTYRQVLAAGDSEHGASIHFVSTELDGGPLISQVRIPVLPGDKPGELAKRLGPFEHRLLTATVELFTNRRVKMDSGTVHVDGKPLITPLLLTPGDTLD